MSKNKMSKSTRTENFDDYLYKRLQDTELALAYLNEALADDDQRVFLLALKDVLAAQGGDITAIAEEANLNRQNIYRILSKTGNPRWSSLSSLVGTLGFQVNLVLKRK